jgi:cell pole-organizing protein PopZ
MANLKTEQEPSIEEILESIRQIISDDGDTQEEPAAEEASADILDLTEIINPEPAVSLEMVDPPPAEEPAAAEQPQIVEEPKAEVPPQVMEEAPEPITQPTTMDKPMKDDQNSLLSAQTADAATEQLSKLLEGNVAVEKDEIARTGKVTLEEMTYELMKPLLKTWLDQNLPGIIEKLVQKEVEKLSRRATDR